MRTSALLLLVLLAATPQARGDQRERDKVKADAVLKSRLAWRDANNQAALSGANRRVPRAPAVTLTEQAKLIGTTREQYDWDGSSVAISGNYAVVGGDGDAYVFVRNGSTWTRQATLTPGDNSYGAFGSSVAIDGDTILIGAWLADGARYLTGAVYVFVRVGTSWISQGKIWANDGDLDSFGYTVALRGSTALVGAPDANSDRGAAYVFVRTGSAWSQQAKLIASDGAAGDRLTWPSGLALSADTAVLGSYYEKNVAYVFVRNGTSWSQQAKLLPTGSSIGFGWNVATHGDLTVFNTGHVYERVGGAWFPRANFSDYKSSVAFDGTRILAGDKYSDGKVAGSGAAYTYRLVNGYWTEEAKLIASDGAYIDIFGDAVGLSGDLAIVGAPYDDDLGSAYAFQLPATAPTSNALRLVAVTPCRVADTRIGQGKIGAFGPPTMNGGQIREFPIPAGTCGIPTAAKAYSLNVTVVPAGPLSYLTIWPTGHSQPLVSTLNSFEGRIVANAAIVPAGTNGSINVYVTGRTDVIIDINGFFAP